MAAEHRISGRWPPQIANEEEIKEKGAELKAIMSLTDEQCDSVEVCVIPDPIAGENENHAVIQKSKTEICSTS